MVKGLAIAKIRAPGPWTGPGGWSLTVLAPQPGERLVNRAASAKPQESTFNMAATWSQCRPAEAPSAPGRFLSQPAAPNRWQRGFRQGCGQGLHYQLGTRHPVRILVVKL